MSVCIRGHCKALRRTAALDLYRPKILLPLHHRSHHRRTGEKSAERCRDHRAGVMIHSRLLHQMARCDRKCADTSLRCGSSYNIISILTHFVLLLLLYFRSAVSSQSLLPARARHHIDPLRIVPDRLLCERVVGCRKLHSRICKQSADRL